MTNLVISAKNLHKSFGDNHVLQGIDIEVPKGTMIALLGPNGAGKTTTVRILSTLLKADQGELRVNGYDVKTEPDRVRSSIGLTGQSASIDELLTGRENLVMMGRLYRLTKQSAKSRAQELLTEFDLVDAADRPAKTYSGGMRRRLDLAVSLIASPPVLFLDEPTTGLDPRSRLVMWNIIQKLKSEGATILLTTQYLEEADQLADSIILIDKGRVAASGTAKELKDKIGKDVLILQIHESSYGSAKKLLSKKLQSHNDQLHELRIPIQSTGKDVAKILEKLSLRKTRITNMDIHKPSLDDVFMSITEKEQE